MAKGQVDSTLVIRAKDEATKAVNAIESALQDLLTTQKQVASGSQSAASGLGQTISALASLDKAYAQIAGASDKGVAAIERQRAALTSNQAQLRALTQQLESARAAQERMNAMIGPPSREAVGRYAAVGAEVKSLEGQIRNLQRAIAQQEAGFQRSTSSLGDMERQTKLAGAVTTFARQESERFTASLERQNAAAERTAALQASIARTTDSRTGKSAADSAAVFRNAGLTAFEKQQAAAADELAAKVARLRAELNPTAIIQDRLNKELAELPRVAKAAGLSVDELTQAEALLRKRADDATRAAIRRQKSGQGGLSLLGLQPHELQNLGYQVNDIVTQLASGASLTQAIAQQGGQIVQIFPRAGSAIVGALGNPVVLTTAATIAAIVAGLKEAGDEADRLRGFMGLLSATADGNAYGAAELNAAAEALDAYGMSAKEAVAAVRTFTREGIDQSRMVEFGQAATDLADVMGVDLKEAVNQVADAFSGGFDAVKKLDDAYNFLTAAQLAQIRTLYDEGRAAEARNTALDIFREKMGDAAGKMRGPWADAVRELSGAWQEFKSLIADSEWIKDTGDSLGQLGRDVASTLRRLRGAATEVDLVQQLETTRSIISGIERDLKDANALTSGGLQANLKYFRDQEASLQRQLDTLKKQNQAAGERGDTLAKQTALQEKQTAGLKEATVAAKDHKTVAEAELEARRKATNFVETEFRFADQATKQAYIAQEVAKAREATQKRIAADTKREADERKRSADEAKRLAQQTKFIDPVSGQVTSGFGPRAAPKAGASTFHKGIDIAVPVGTEVKAPAGGVVIETGTDAKLGKFLFIDHGNNTVSKFGHLSDNSIVSPGQIVTQGQAVARSGNTGNSTGPHLHYQVEVNGKAVDPSKGVFVDDGLARFKTDLADAVSDYDKIVEKQDEFLAGLDRANADRQRDTAQMTAQAGLTGDALLAVQKQAEIEDAIAKARADAEKVGLKAGDPALELRIQKLREVMGAYYDAAHARDTFENQRAAVDQPVQDLTALRDSLQERIRFFQESGQTGLANQLLPQLDLVNSKLLEAIGNARSFYDALATNPEAMAALGLTEDQIETIKLGLDSAATAGRNLGYILGIAGQTIAQTFASTATNAIDRFAQSVAEGQNVFKSLKQAFLQFAADFLRQIANMIIQQMIFNIVAGALGGGLGGGGGAKVTGSTGAFAGIKAHGGGVIGDSSTYGHGTGIVPVDPSWFHTARRYHTGGIAGLRPDEVPAVLKRNEEVLTQSDPRHRDNGGMAQQPKVTVVNTLDPSEFLSKALGSGRGDHTVLNWMRANSAAVKQALG